MAQAAEKWISEPLRPAQTVSLSPFALPPLSCDAHMHVFGPVEQYPAAADAKYTQPEGPLAGYLAVAERLGIARMVFVQASFYGNDNRCILDAMRQVGSGSRGVVFLSEDTTVATAEDLYAKGVRGLRLDLFKADRDGCTTSDVLARLEAARRLAKLVGWHLELYAPGLWVRRLLPTLAGLDVDFSVNHMGYMTEKEGLGEDDFRRFLELTRNERCWVKLTGPYRIDNDVTRPRTDWMARELIASAPERLLWGSDWPHIPQGGRDTGELLARFASWCPDERLRAMILVDNPARFYGFP